MLCQINYYHTIPYHTCTSNSEIVLFADGAKMFFNVESNITLIDSEKTLNLFVIVCRSHLMLKIQNFALGTQYMPLTFFE